jgi:hypothetical protein
LTSTSGNHSTWHRAAISRRSEEWQLRLRCLRRVPFTHFKIADGRDFIANRLDLDNELVLAESVISALVPPIHTVFYAGLVADAGGEKRASRRDCEHE